MVDTAKASETDAASWDLDDLSDARRLCDWMYAQYEDAVQGLVVEVGAGVGTFSGRILDQGRVEQLLLLEPDERCVSVLHEKYDGDARVVVADETIPGSALLAEHRGQADFVLCQNVLEHIDDDYAAAQAMADALKPGGELTILVPAHPRLFGSLDRQFGHFRRYTRDRLRDVVQQTGLELTRLGSFNALGIPGWWVKGRMGATELGSGSLAAYEALVRLWRPIEDRIKLPIGLSVIARARKAS